MTTDGLWSATSGPTSPTVTTPKRVVLVHGTLDRAAGLLKLSRRLDADHTVTRYDRRGYGRSRPLGGPYTIDQHIRDLEQVVETGDAPVVLFGHSYGGNVALGLADRRPDLVSGVMVYESPMSWLPDWEGSTGRADDAEWRADPEGAAERFMQRLVTKPVWDRLPAQTRQDRRSEGVTMVDELLDLRSSAPWTPDRIHVPVIAAYGANAMDHHRRAMINVANMLIAGELAEVDEAGHFGPNTHPDPVAGLLRRLLD